MKLVILMSLSIMLIGCSSKSVEPSVVTEYEVVNVTIPADLLEVTPAPSPEMLRDVKIVKGKRAMRKYGTGLFNAHHTNAERIRAIRELVK